MTYPPQVLDCPDTAGCPVAAALPELRTATVPAGRLLYRAYAAPYGYDEHNPVGNARFSPFDDPAAGARIPAMYLAQDRSATLLESVFHDIDDLSSDPVDRIIYEQSLLGTLLAHIRTPAPAILGDLRNDELGRLGLERSATVSSPSEHYPCTRRLAVQAVNRTHHGTYLDGLIWHSRKAELIGRAAMEVMVLFGHRYHPARGSWSLVAPGVQNLWEGAGPELVDEVATLLRATVV